VTLLLSDGTATAQWDTTVAFTAATLRWPLLGQAGFLQFFDVELHGASHEAILTPNVTFPGQHVVYQQPPP
jgi:hypothetical protein